MGVLEDWWSSLAPLEPPTPSRHTFGVPLSLVHQVASLIAFQTILQLLRSVTPDPSASLVPFATCLSPHPPSCPHLHHPGLQPFHGAITSPDRVPWWSCALYKDHVHDCSVTRLKRFHQLQFGAEDTVLSTPRMSPVACVPVLP